MYSDIESAVINNGFTSEYFKLSVVSDKVVHYLLCCFYLQ